MFILRYLRRNQEKTHQDVSSTITTRPLSQAEPYSKSGEILVLSLAHADILLASSSRSNHGEGYDRARHETWARRRVSFDGSWGRESPG